MTETKSLTPERLNELEQIAKAATGGPWFTVGPPWLPSDVETYVIAGDMDPHAGEIVCDMPSPGDVQDESGDMPAEFVTGRNWANATHIAAFNPATVLALLSEVRALRESVKAYREWREAFIDYGLAELTESGPTLQQAERLAKAEPTLSPSSTAKEQA